MNINNNDPLRYAARMILLVIPLAASLTNIWSWMIELLLILAIFIHNRDSGLRRTIIFLAIGYLASLVPLGYSGIMQIGFSPWAAVLLVGLKGKGFSTKHSMFWSLMLAVLLSAIPVIPAVLVALQPENLQKEITSTLLFYEQQGVIGYLQKAGLDAAQFENNLRVTIPLSYQLMPAFSGLIGMIEVGFSYFLFRRSRREKKLRSFSLWQLPWYAIWVAIAGLAGYLGGDYLGNNVLKISGMNIMIIMSSISLIMGLSCLAYFFKKQKASRWMWVLVIIASILSIVILFGFIIFGLLDLVFNFRHIPEENEGENNENNT